MKRKFKRLDNPQNLTWPQFIGYMAALVAAGIAIAYIIAVVIPNLVEKL